MTSNILILNAGSSTLKYKLIRMGDGETILAHGDLDRAVEPEAARRVVETCRSLGIDAVGHRIVHGGSLFTRPTRITAAVVDDIRQTSHLAPLHNGAALAVIEAVTALLPDKPSVAVFDTAFHQTMPPVAMFYALAPSIAGPNDLRRYGFHGISHRFVSGRLLECLGRPAAGSRLITAHLGNGASLCAIRDGRSIDTSMGMTPMEGLVMGTRCGDIDAGLVLHMMERLKMSTVQVNEFLNDRCGLLGVSGRSQDVRELETAAKTGDGPAAMALEMFAYRTRKYIGAYAAALGGLDAMAFCGGIGENGAVMRQRICQDLQFLGIQLDATRNSQASGKTAQSISADRSPVQVWVVPTDEELQIAREIATLLA
jgi:acetate kinase